jgi:hypothetical protein
MKKKIIGALLAATIAFVVSGCATPGNPAAWTYKVVSVTGSLYPALAQHPPEAEKTINRMTSEGWHLVSVSADGRENSEAHTLVIVFKKQK